MKLTPPPHQEAFHACMMWWRGLDPKHRPIFDRAMLNQFWRACKGLDLIPDSQMVETIQREFSFS